MMRHPKIWSLAPFAVAACLAFSFSSCSGGGGGSGLDESPVLLRISMQGVSTPLWQNVNGTPTPAPACPTNVPLNGKIIFTFGGPVDPTSIPSSGQADGSIIISATIGAQTTVALGSFNVVDEPGLPPGNMRRVEFQPSLPNSPSNPTQAGLTQGVQYTVFVPRGGSTTQVVRVAGQDLTNEALTCFVGCQITQGTPATACFVDSIPGPPVVTGTTPTFSNPVGPPIDPSTITSNTISIFISEPLDPTNVNVQNVLLLRAGGTIQVPGSVFFTQAGVDPTLPPDTSRIDYVASSQLLASTVYEIQFTSAVTDFGGNSVVVNPGAPPSDQKIFMETIAVPFCGAQIVEDFTSTVNRGEVGIPLVWDGSGQLFATFPSDLVGDGSDGAIVFTAAGSPHTVDVDAIPFGMPGFEGVWNATSLTVEPGATVIFKGSWPIEFKVQGPVTIGANAVIDGNAPTPDNPTDPLEGPWKGGVNNAAPTIPFGGANIIEGGRGGPGGGKGGRASQAGHPDRTIQAETGEGPFVNGVPGQNPTDPFYGPGEGGEGAPQVMSTIGAGGGGGGSAYGAGGDGIPLNGINSTGLCGAPLPAPQITPADGGDFPMGYVPPLSEVRGGNGGGGGGDRFDLVTATLNLDDQGGGGGGGGGGIRISAVGSITLDSGARIEMNGSSGNNSESLGPGAGGSGSGGMIWLQSFQDVDIHPMANLQVHGGACPTGPAGLLTYRCSSAPGLGGEGLFQFEDSDGMVNIGFMGSDPQAPSTCGTNQQNPSPLPPLPEPPTGNVPVGPAENIAVIEFPFSNNIGNTATSVFFDTGYGAPNYLPADNTGPDPDEAFTLGNVPGGSVTIRYQGAPEDFVNPGTPSSDPNTWSAWVTGADLPMLNGFRFIRFEVRIEYDSPPASNASNTFPAVQQIRINYETPLVCP